MFSPKLQYGKESCPNYFTMGENLDHAQIMEALFLPYFWKHDRWRCNFLPIAQNMVDGIWTELFFTGGDALTYGGTLCMQMFGLNLFLKILDMHCCGKERNCPRLVPCRAPHFIHDVAEDDETAGSRLLEA
jgi:hypothetical protein